MEKNSTVSVWNIVKVSFKKETGPTSENEVDSKILTLLQYLSLSLMYRGPTHVTIYWTHNSSDNLLYTQLKL